MSEIIEFPRNKILGNDDIVIKILNLWAIGKLPQALLLSGNKGIGKASVAMQLAAIMVSQNPEAPENEDAYSFINPRLQNNEIKKISARIHSNFLLLSPNQEEEKKATDIISIDQVRKINEFLHLIPNNNYARIVLIDSVDELNQNSANALLKNLEEPPLNTHFFLISHNISKVLPTIRSRSQNFAFKPLSTEDMRLILSSKMQNIDDYALKLSGGNMDFALLLSSVEGIGLYHSIKNAFENEITLDSILWLNSVINNDNSKYALKIFFGIIKEKLVEKSKSTKDSKDFVLMWDTIVQLESDIEKIHLSPQHSIMGLASKLVQLRL